MLDWKKDKRKKTRNEWKVDTNVPRVHTRQLKKKKKKSTLSFINTNWINYSGREGGKQEMNGKWIQKLKHSVMMKNKKTCKNSVSFSGW